MIILPMRSQDTSPSRQSKDSINPSLPPRQRDSPPHMSELRRQVADAMISVIPSTRPVPPKDRSCLFRPPSCPRQQSKDQLQSWTSLLLRNLPLSRSRIPTILMHLLLPQHQPSNPRFISHPIQPIHPPSPEYLPFTVTLHTFSPLAHTASCATVPYPDGMCLLRQPGRRDACSHPQSE